MLCKFLFRERIAMRMGRDRSMPGAQPAEFERYMPSHCGAGLSGLRLHFTTVSVTSIFTTSPLTLSVAVVYCED